MSEHRDAIGVIPHIQQAGPKISLEVTKGTEVGRKVACSRVVTLIGSRHGCKLVLRHNAVSPVHLAVVHDGQHAHAVDLVSKHGSMLNGLKLEYERLSNGDMLSIDPWEFRVRTSDIDPNMGQAPLDLEPTPHVVALEHVASGRILQPHREVCVIGRQKGCDIWIASQRVSRVHSLLITYMGHPAIVDLLSTQQTVVNGEPIVFRVLRNDDVITIADTDFRVRMMHPGEKNKQKPRDDVTPNPDAPPAVSLAEDQIDIGNVEGSQTWRIADNYEKMSRRA